MEESDTIALFRGILEQGAISTVFQPIVSLRDGSIFGYEALSRGPADSPLHSPMSLINAAKRCGMSMQLERLFFRAAMENARRIPENATLFVNIVPGMIRDGDFRSELEDSLRRFSANYRGKVIFELTERENIGDIEAFCDVVAGYRENGCRIAIDDVGAGYSGLNLISSLHPQYIKLDMELIRGIDRDPVRQAMVQCMGRFATLTNIMAIAEGIETPEEMSKLIELDIPYGQGYLIQRPAETPAALDNAGVSAVIFRENKIKNRSFGVRLHEFYARNIKCQALVVSPDFLASEVEGLFNREKNLPGVCVVDREIPVGIITREKYYERLGGRFGYSLHASKPVAAIMDGAFMAIDSTATIDTAATLAMSREPNRIYDFVVLVSHGKYDGIVTVKDLLEKSIEIGVANAKNLNPLSELPGNMFIDAQLEKLIAIGQDRCVLYFDLDNFKAYNDYFGFRNGDNVLRRLTNILREHAAGDRFLGHIGGDDFIMIVDNGDADAVCRSVIRGFDGAVRGFYGREDLERGFITVKNRKSVEERFPLMSLSVAGVRSVLYANSYALAESAAALKKICKRNNGSSYLIEAPQKVICAPAFGRMAHEAG